MRTSQARSFTVLFLLPVALFAQVQTIPNTTFPAVRSLLNSNFSSLQGAVNGKEPVLGNPSVTGYVLSSTTGGVRSWVAQTGGGGSVVWGTITGTLSSQTDLNAALTSKEPALGNPSVNGYVLSSTTGGSRSWVAQSGGSGVAPFTCALSAVSSIACTHNLGTTTPWVSCYDGSGNMLGGSGASTSVTSIIATNTNVVTLTFSGSTTGTCVISTGSMGPKGDPGATGPAGAAGTGTGDFSSNTSSSVDSEIMLFSSTNGKVGKRATGTGYVKVASGVMGTPAAIPIADLPANDRVRTACIPFGGKNAASVLVDADLADSDLYPLPTAGTLIEIIVRGDGGTPNVILGRDRAGTVVNLTSAALATAASGGVACSNAGGTTGINGVTTCSSTLQNTGLLAGDWIKPVSGTAGGAAKQMSACFTWMVN